MIGLISLERLLLCAVIKEMFPEEEPHTVKPSTCERREPEGFSDLKEQANT